MTTNQRTNLKMRAAIDYALAGCETQKEKEALLFGVRLTIDLMKATEEELAEAVK